jgi:AcrR family transcriptional regulator
LSPRAYRQTARANAVEETEQQIIGALRSLLTDRWFDEITLDDIAAGAGTTRQTVIRRFGSKTGVLNALAATINDEVRARRWGEHVPAVEALIAVLVDDYEAIGDMVVRTLSQETRNPEFGAILEVGRIGHREWVEDMFARWLAPLGEARRTDLVSELVVITDVWVWHLLRRVQGKSRETAQRLMTEMTRRILQM